MVKLDTIKDYFKKVNETMQDNREYLVKLDQQNGDGDLGISMSNGFKSFFLTLNNMDGDIGLAIYKSAMAFNEAAPSSLGTLLSLAFIAVGKKLKGKETISEVEIIEALDIFNDEIMEKGGAKEGEKTILDSLVPTATYIKNNFKIHNLKEFSKELAAFSKSRAEETKNMKAIHGRAAYYEESSIGVMDGGSYVGYLLFESFRKFIDEVGV